MVVMLGGGEDMRKVSSGGAFAALGLQPRERERAQLGAQLGVGVLGLCHNAAAGSRS